MEFEKDHKNILLALLVIMLSGLVFYMHANSNDERIVSLENRVYNLENNEDLSNQKINGLKEGAKKEPSVIYIESDISSDDSEEVVETEL